MHLSKRARVEIVGSCRKRRD